MPELLLGSSLENKTSRRAEKMQSEANKRMNVYDTDGFQGQE